MRDYWPDDPTFQEDQLPAATWQKEVNTHPRRPVLLPPRPSLPPPRSPLFQVGAILDALKKRLPPAVFFWSSMGLLLLLIFGGVFGIVIALGHGPANGNALALQVSPRSVVVGATVTLRGTHFMPRGRIGLTRDSTVPVADTGGATIIQADTSGNFSDTVIAGEWGNGVHIINAEDAISHKIASFPLLVSGQSAMLRPAHLLVAQNRLDLGSGDQATNTSRIIALNNTGGGEISWQASSSAPWLQMSPISGTLYSGIETSLHVAAGRSNMPPGVYTAQLTIMSNAGEAVLPVRMEVTPLQVGDQAVIELNPALLSFTTADGAASPRAQTVMLSNPGVLALNWKVTTNAPWLLATPIVGSVASSAQQEVSVGINSTTMLPGSYSGIVTFSAQNAGYVKNSPQSIYVNLTVTPHCALQLSPSVVSFASAYQQGKPAAQTISVGTTHNCKAAIQWNATTDASWLQLSQNSGTTPASPSVTVNTTGLKPGVHSAAITFTSASNTQVLPVTFTLGASNAPTLTSGPDSETFQVRAGTGSVSSQSMHIQNAGSGTLNWQATVTTVAGGNWLSVTPANGTLGTNQAQTLQVQASPLSTLLPGTTYTGAIVVSAFNSTGQEVAGSPQRLAVNLLVIQPCTISVPPTLSFSGNLGQSASDTQFAFIRTSGGCTHALSWTASTSASWLRLSSTAGSVTGTRPASLGVSVDTSGLTPTPHQATITVNAFDSITHAAVGATQHIKVTLVVQSGCSLTGVSPGSLHYQAEAGFQPAPQTFTVSTAGQCSGSVLITPQISAGWLTVMPSSMMVAPGDSATFSIMANTNNLPPATTYSGHVTLNASNNGVALAGGVQPVQVDLQVLAAPALTTSPSAITMDVAAGTASQAITISNTGGTPLNWTATLANGSANVVSLVTPASNTLAGGASTTLVVNIDTSGAVAGQNYIACVLVSAFDAANGNVLAGSPAKIPVTVNVAPSTTSATPSASPTGPSSLPGPMLTPSARRIARSR
jgi:hypothetical protein